MFEMTFNQALRIQKAQMVWYRQSIGREGIKAIKKATKYPVDLNPNELMFTGDINELVPRGGSFERYIKRVGPDDPNKMAWYDMVYKNKEFSS